MSIYKDYIEEQLPNRFVYETDYGFVTYNIIGTICQLEEIYVIPEYRRQGKASLLYCIMGDIAREKECTHLKGQIIIGTNNAEGSMKCLFENGFKLSGTDGILIYLMKQL